MTKPGDVDPSRTAAPAHLDLPRRDSVIDEWIFTAWSPSGEAGLVSGHRLIGRRAWYWTAFASEGQPLLHLAEFEVSTRPDWQVVKAPEMWAEHVCVEPLRQWTLGNEAHFAELDHPDDALGRAYGVPRPTGFDLEWYAIGGAQPLGGQQPNDVGGFRQAGVVHGTVEVLGRAATEFEEAPSTRWRRWSYGAALPPLRLDRVVAHTGLRIPFAFPDGSKIDWVVTADGFRERTEAAHSGR